MEVEEIRNWPNPQQGTGSSVPAGETIELTFEVSNDRPMPVTFSVEIEGLPPEWLPSNPSKSAVAPEDRGVARIRISPDWDATPSEYSFLVRLFRSKNEEWPEPRNLTLKVVEPVRPRPISVAPEPEPEPEPVPEPVATVEPEPPAPIEPAAKEEPPVEEPPKPAAKKEPPPPAEPEAKQPEPKPEAKVEPPIEEPIPEPPQEDSAEQKAEEEAAEVKRAIRAGPRAPAPPKPEPPKVEPPKEEPKPAPKAKEEPKPEPKPEPKVVDFEPTPSKPAAVSPFEAPKDVDQPDRIVPNPKDGQVIQVKPGDRVLVKFTFTNDVPRGTLQGTRTFILQENQQIPRDWIALIQDQVNVTPGGTGELSLMLKPPVTAEPTSYAFVAYLGPLGQALAPTNLVLEVLPMPAVAIKAARASNSVWFKTDVPFDVTVSSTGNAETAYRLAVRSPEEDPDRPEGKLPDEIYETANWRYLIEREEGDLRSPVTGRPPEPENHKVVLRRRNPWWFGFKETHSVKLACVPVTDPANGAKTENIVELKATRVRPWPMPLAVLVPILAVIFGYFFFRETEPAVIDVPNAYAVVGHTAYVLDDQYKAKDEDASVNIDLDWQDKPNAKVIRKDMENKVPPVMVGKGITPAPLGTQYSRTYVFGEKAKQKVTIIGLRNDFDLVFWRSDVLPADVRRKDLSDRNSPESKALLGWFRTVLQDTPHQEKCKDGKQHLIWNLDLKIPVGTTQTINFKNISNADAQKQIFIAQTKEPHDCDATELFTNGDRLSEGNHQEIGFEAVMHVKFTPRKDGDLGTWEIITSDSKTPIIRFHIEGVEK